MTRASGGNLARTPGLHPYSLREVPWDFLVTTESQDLGLTSHPKDGLHNNHPVQIRKIKVSYDAVLLFSTFLNTK